MNPGFQKSQYSVLKVYILEIELEPTRIGSVNINRYLDLLIQLCYI